MLCILIIYIISIYLSTYLPTYLPTFLPTQLSSQLASQLATHPPTQLASQLSVYNIWVISSLNSDSKIKSHSIQSKIHFQTTTSHHNRFTKSKVFFTWGKGVTPLAKNFLTSSSWKILPSRLPHQIFIPQPKNKFHVIT